MTAADLAARSLAAIWHPCTQMAQAAHAPPLAMVRGQGPWLFDADGRRYFDANSSWWVNLFGHSDERIKAAIAQQLQTLPHVMLAGCTHEPAVRLAEMLSARTEGALGHVFFASDGASATEIALKMSFHSWANAGQGGKREFVCLRGGYHGETLGALAVTDVQIFRDAYDPLLLRAHLVDSPADEAQPLADAAREAASLAQLQALLIARAPHIAALIVEPLVQCAAGMRMHSPAFLRALRVLTRTHGVHLIVDEIAMGCGRSGRFFAFEHARADAPDTPWPDFVTLSKGITAGTLPLSLVLTTDSVFQQFWHPDAARGFLHSHSYSGNALACAAAVAVLERFEGDGLLAELATQGERLHATLTPSLQADARIRHIRQRGMVLAFDVDEAVAGDGFAQRFHLAARAHELLIRPIGRSVYLMPPYLLDTAHTDHLAGAVLATLGDVLA